MWTEFEAHADHTHMLRDVGVAILLETTSSANREVN